MRVRRARIDDIPDIQALIAHYAGEGILLPRDEDDIRRQLDGFLVIVDRRRFAGCVAEPGSGTCYRLL